MVELACRAKLAFPILHVEGAGRGGGPDGQIGGTVHLHKRRGDNVSSRGENKGVCGW
jgi:hypothetical protein